MRTLILAGSFREAATYARGKELRHYRFASSADAVANFQAQRVVELPGYARRADRHSLNAIANRVVRRGGEWVKDSYTPPAVEETPLTKLQSFTRTDWLFGNLSSDDLREVGATDEEVAEVERIKEIQETVVAPAVAKQKRTRTRKPRVTPGPPATRADLASAKAMVEKTKTDDPFEA